MIDPKDKLETALQAALRFAALQDDFSPGDAIKAAREAMDKDKISPLQTALLLTELKARTSSQSETTNWSLTNSARQTVLGKIKSGGDNDFLSSDSAIVRVMEGRENFKEAAIAELVREVAALETTDNPLVHQLRDVVTALDKVGEHAAGYGHLSNAVAALNRLEELEKSERMRAAEFVGREDELVRIRKWAASGHTNPPLHTLFITGLPGIGKSYLLNRAIAEIRAESKPIVLRLDFDRNGLTLNDRDKIVHELSRQLGNALPQASAILRRMRLKYANNDNPQGRDILPTELVSVMAKTVRESERSLIVVLDTLEVLRGHGETHPMRLFDLLDDLVSKGLSPMAVIAAGRGDALDPVEKRVDHPIIELGGLHSTHASQLLGELGVDPSLHDAIYARSNGGHPLKLRLWARMSDQLGDVEGDVTSAYLYRALLSRIDDPLLVDLADPGLILRRISAGAMEYVLAPALGLADQVNKDRAAQLFDALSRHHWLVENQSPGWLSHRRDLRAEILPMLYEENPEDASKIDRLAAKWFADNDPETALYHALQATRAGDRMPTMDVRGLIGFSDEDIAELPQEAQEIINQTLGMQSQRVRAKRPPSSRIAAKFALATLPSDTDLEMAFAAPAEEPAREASDVAIRDLEMALKRLDLTEAHSNRTAPDFPERPAPNTPTGHVAMANAWLTGRWSEAMRLYRALDGQDRQSLFADKEDNSLYTTTAFDIEAERRFASLTDLLIGSPDEFERALQTRRDGMKLAVGGAADIVLLLTDQTRERAIEVVSNANRDLFAIGRGMYKSATDMLREAESLTRRYQIEMVAYPKENFVPDHRSPVVAHAISRLNPMIRPLNALTMTRHSPMLADYLVNLFEKFDVLMESAGGFDQIKDPEAFRSNMPEDGPVFFGALGLTCDWAPAFALFHRVSNIGHVARAAERWRRFSIGKWVYPGPPPPDWKPNHDPDPAIRIRVETMFKTDAEFTARQVLKTLAGSRERMRRVLDRSVSKPLVKVAQATTEHADPMERAMTIAEAMAARLYGPALSAAIGVLAAAPQGAELTPDEMTYWLIDEGPPFLTRF